MFVQWMNIELVKPDELDDLSAEAAILWLLNIASYLWTRDVCCHPIGQRSSAFFFEQQDMDSGLSCGVQIL